MGYLLFLIPGGAICSGVKMTRAVGILWNYIIGGYIMAVLEERNIIVQAQCNHENGAPETILVTKNFLSFPSVMFLSREGYSVCVFESIIRNVVE